MKVKYILNAEVFDSEQSCIENGSIDVGCNYLKNKPYSYALNKQINKLKTYSKNE